MANDGDRFHYFRDHETGMWGVRDSATGRIVGIKMDKTDAAVIALFLSDRTSEAIRARDDFAKLWDAAIL